ncbi:single-stranded DNA-binding protein [Streptomyces sp. NPDC052013]|uniref:single-stranded DNA-binding protein n=1 Tax=Streptomyces sp. NPDC052013 TaxID=3365679 RepID=UPI0037D3A243
MTPTVTHVTGTVAGDVEVRFTQDGIAVCRFRLTETPTQWDAAARKWRDLDPVPYICTAWRDLATNATESLVDGVNVLITGRITEIKDNSIYLSVDDLGISLRRRITYTETSLPSPIAARPITAPPAPQPATASLAGHRTAGRPTRLVGAEAGIQLVLVQSFPPHSRRRHSPSRRPPAPARHRFACRCRALPEGPAVMPAHALSKRAARAARAAHFASGQLAADLGEYTPAEVWDRHVRADGSGQLAQYKPHEELAQAELNCPLVIPSDEGWPTALNDLGPACPLGLWVRGRERLAG